MVAFGSCLNLTTWLPSELGSRSTRTKDDRHRRGCPCNEQDPGGDRTCLTGKAVRVPPASPCARTFLAAQLGRSPTITRFGLPRCLFPLQRVSDCRLVLFHCDVQWVKVTEWKVSGILFVRGFIYLWGFNQWCYLFLWKRKLCSIKQKITQKKMCITLISALLFYLLSETIFMCRELISICKEALILENTCIF